MSFLLPFISEREQTSNLAPTVSDNESEDEIDITKTTNSQISDSQPTSPQSPQNSAPTPSLSSMSSFKSVKDRQQVPMSKIVQNYFEKKLASKKPPLQEKDHLTKFFEAMEETVRTFEPHLQIEIKGKMSALVTEYELKNFHDRQTTTSCQSVQYINIQQPQANQFTLLGQQHPQQSHYSLHSPPEFEDSATSPQYSYPSDSELIRGYEQPQMPHFQNK